MVRRDFHSKLLRSKVIGTKDMKKLNKLYGGWGLTAGQARDQAMERDKNASMMKIALNFLSERLQYYQKEKEYWRASAWEWRCRVDRKSREEQFRSLLEVKREFIEELWRRQKRMSNRSLTWLLEGGDGVKLLLFTQKPQTTSVYCPSDNYLINKFGRVE